MAVVYEAIDTKLGEKRALKFSKSGHAHSIPPEARAALKVTHENVCRAFEIHTAETKEGPTDFISMEFVEGETLAQRWKREPLTLAEALEIARQLCRGVEAAHQAKVLHLDLKSSNVMLAKGANGATRVIVMDFGLAQAFGAGSGRLAGTPNYIAPERYLGAEPTPACDLYAMGVILYEMLTGRLPFPKSADLSTRHYKVPPAPSKAGGRPVDKRWDAVVLRCLEADPDRRTPTAAALLAAIDKAFAVSHRRKWAAGAVICAALGSGAYVYWPEPPLARLAVLPMTGTTGDKNLDGTLHGELAEVSERLESLGAASRRLVLIQPEEAARQQADTAEKAGGRLGATHVLVSAIQGSGEQVHVHAEVREVKTGDRLQGFDGDFPKGELPALSTSLAGVVTSAFRLPKALPAEVKPLAYPFYAFGVGLLTRERTSYDRALAQFDTAREFDPDSPMIFAAQSTAYLQKYTATKDEQWLTKAREAAENARRLNPDSAGVLLALGSVEREDGRPEEALAHYRRALELEPGRSETWHRIGMTYLKLGKDQEAVSAMRKAIELAPGYFRPHSAMGTIHFQYGRLAEAIEEFRIVTQLAPTQPEGYSNLGGMLLTAEREAEAEKALRRALELRGSSSARNNLGVLLRYQHRDAEAAAVFAESLKAGADTIALRLNLANALKATGRMAEAKPHFERAGEMARAMLLKNPRDADARARLSYVEVQTGSLTEGLNNALQAARLDGSSYAVLFWVTMTLEALGKRELIPPLLQGATPAQLKDLRRQPDLQKLARDPAYAKLFQKPI